MNRRNLLKGAAAAGALAALPQLVMADNSSALPIHFVGLGGAGCNGAAAIYKEQPNDFFNCITSPGSKALPVGASFIPFTPRVPIALRPVNYSQFPPVLTAAMQQLFSQPHHFVLLAGLGGYTGTSLLQIFTQQLLVAKQPFTAIACLPFRFEQPRRQAVEDLLPALQTIPGLYTFDLAALAADEAYKKLKLNQFFEFADRQFYKLFLQHRPL